MDATTLNSKSRIHDEKVDDSLVPTPIPALIALLLNKEQAKGTQLTEAEVLEIRDNAVCIMLPRSEMLAIEESRG
ncbi:MAG: hypothetical protein ABI171_07250 [Collimonas sp.]|uniref:hypothetical protein n=1 Tax=Collimonas sp. TaxID=1963772 RepID=UPI00326361D0